LGEYNPETNQYRARRYEAPRGWRVRGLAVAFAVFGVSLAVGRLWGSVFGTFRNPAAGEAHREAGFYAGASSRIGEMLAFQDVSAPRRGITMAAWAR
jgi:hypothetical protein